MGLKEAGLRGSLRSTSSVLPAFFDVAITNTNSPVTEGDILTVDYSANNTGDIQDTQDIRLEIDSVEEDRDSNVTLGGGVSTTGTLQWDTTNESTTTYTATVLSDDDSDSVTVEVQAPAIPDSVIHQWDFDDAGSAGTLTDQVGSADGTINGWSYVTTAIQGSHAGDHDGTDDFTDLPTGLFPDRTADWTYATWVNLDSLGSDDRIIDFRGDFQQILNVGRSGTDTLGLFQNSTDFAIRTISTGTDYWILVEHDSSVPEVRVEVNRTQELTISSTPDSPGISTNTFFSNGASVGNHPDGRQDETIIADSLLSNNEKDTLYSRGSS